MKIEKINEEIGRAKEKVAEWQARLRDLEKQKTEQENIEILQVVRRMATSPEEIRGLLDRIKTAKEPTQTTINKEEPNIEKE